MAYTVTLPWFTVNSNSKLSNIAVYAVYRTDKFIQQYKELYETDEIFFYDYTESASDVIFTFDTEEEKAQFILKYL